MKRILLVMAAAIITLAANAQGFTAKKFCGKLEKAFTTESVSPRINGKFRAPAKVSKVSSLPSNQRYLGYYDTDDIDGALGLGSMTTQPIEPGALLTSANYSKFVGGKVVGIRFAMGTNATASNVAVYGLTDVSLDTLVSIDTTIVSQSTESGTTQATYRFNGVWNTVMFPADKQFVIGNNYTGYLAAYKVNQGQNTYPVGVYSGASGELYVNANIPSSYGGSGQGWYSFGTGYGAPAIQLIVEKEFPKNDLGIEQFILDNDFYEAGSTGKYGILVKNYGSAKAKYNLNLTLDDNAVATLSNANATIVNDSLDILASDTIYGQFTVPSDAAVGKHELKVTVTTINAAAPTELADDDALGATFRAYTETKPRQRNLIEHHTSSTCTYCYLGEKLLESVADILGDTIAWVSIHGNQSAKDPTNTEQCDTIISYQELEGWPSAGFNRTVVEGSSYLMSIGVPENYLSQYAPLYANVIKETGELTPSFVTLDIEPAFEGRKVSLNIKGTGVDGAEKIIDNQRLYVYLAEDSVKFNQYSNGKWVRNDNHNHVFRVALGTVFGNPINWNGSNFDATYTYDIPSSWDIKNMKAVAFVAPSLDADITKSAVNQTEEVYLTNAYIAAGIKGITSSATTDMTVIARYNAAGQRITVAQKGLNILKLANGKTVKVIVK